MFARSRRFPQRPGSSEAQIPVHYRNSCRQVMPAFWGFRCFAGIINIRESTIFGPCRLPRA